MDELRNLLHAAADHAADYRTELPRRPVAPPGGVTDVVAQVAAALGGPLPTQPTAPAQVLEQLVSAADPGLVSSVGPRFFGFVIGGSLPAATAAEVMAAAWDQCAFNAVLSPAAAAAEEVAGTWLKELLGLPAQASVGFVTGAQEANTVGLAAARHHVLSNVGWDVEAHGLAGAPRVRVVAGVERHATIDRSLRLLGLGGSSVAPVDAGPQGAIDLADLEKVLSEGGESPVIVCLQAGNVNTGACDDLEAACDLAERYDAWVHVDGAFGLWAAAAPTRRHLVRGLERADSWGCDGHKWLNLPYDSGFAFCAHPESHARAASYTAAYLVGSGGSDARMADLTLGSSRRARGFAAWAGLKQLGRQGVEELVERSCELARRFADGLAAGGAEVVNDVVLNQVLVGFGDDDRTERVIARVQTEGTCWLGGTTWRGRRLMRVSVSNHTTTQDDVDRSVRAILESARGT